MNSVPTVGFGTGYPLLLVPCGTGSSQKHAIKSVLTVGNLVPASPSIHHVALALATIHHLICALSWGFVTNSPSVIGTTQYRLITKTKTRHQVPASSGDFVPASSSVHPVVLALSTMWHWLPSKIHHLTCAHGRGFVTNSPSVIGTLWYRLPSNIPPSSQCCQWGL